MGNIDNKEIETAVDQEEQVDDDSQLDKELEESLAAVKAGEKLSSEEDPAEPEKSQEEPDEESDDSDSGESPDEKRVEDNGTPPSDDDEGDQKKEEYKFRIPKQGKFESDEAYEKRVELLDLVNKRKAAKTSESREELSGQIKTAKNQLKTINGSDRTQNPLSIEEEDKGDKPKEETDDPVLAQDKERLKKLGGVTRDELEKVIAQERLAVETKSALEDFVSRHKDLQDPDVREVFFDFVDDNYKWQGKGRKELLTTLELARENMFRPSESIEERVLKSTDVQKKVKSMQFPGGAKAKAGLSEEKQKSVDEMVATGVIDEETAVELLSD